MSENSTENAAPEGQNADGNNGGETSTTDKPFNLTQEEFNHQLNERVKRERAKFADYGDLKAKASRLDEIEEANKTEVQKASERLAAAERERDEARIDGLRFKVAVKHGISEEDAELFLTGRDEESLTRQAERLAEREIQRKEAAAEAEAERKKQGNHVRREGAITTATESDERQAVRGLFG